MSEGKEQTAESDTRQQSIQDDYNATLKRLTYRVLRLHDDLDEHYLGMSTEEHIETVESVIYSPDLQGIRESLLLYHIERYFEVYRKPITVRPLKEHDKEHDKEHHFAKPFDECFQTYRSGFFIACTMLSHAVNEGIINFVARRHNLELGKRPRVKKTIRKLKELTPVPLPHEIIQAAETIRDSCRDNIIHMNPQITDVEDWHGLAKTNLRNLAIVESCVFDYKFEDGNFQPRFPDYWDKGEDGHVEGVLKINEVRTPYHKKECAK